MGKDWGCMANPYVIEGMVEDPGMFFGRRVHLRRLLHHVGEMDCVSVVGLPGMGKSSLLYQIARQESLQQTHVCSYIDLSDTALQSPPALVRRVMGELGRRTGRTFVGSTTDRLEHLLITLLQEEKLHVLLCLDEFHQFASAPGVDHAFLNELRRLGFARLLSLVVASVDPPEELVRQGVIPRLMLRLFDECIDLGLLAANEADRLIRRPLLQQGVEFPPQALEWARELGGRYPLYLQLAGYYLFEQLLSAGGVDPQALRQQFAEAAFPHLHRLWASLSPQEREASRYYGGVADIRPPGVGTRQALLRKGVLERRGAEYCLFSEHFREVVRRRRRDLEEPLPVLKEAPPPEVHVAAPGETAGQVSAPPGVQVAPRGEGGPDVALPPKTQASALEEAPVEVPVPAAEGTGPLVEEEPGPSVAPLSPMDVQRAALEGPSPREVSSLAALGCYVLAITVDLVFIVGIVTARLLFRLPTREMYVLIGLSAVFPILFLFLGRVSGGLWARLFGRLVGRL